MKIDLRFLKSYIWKVRPGNVFFLSEMQWNKSTTTMKVKNWIRPKDWIFPKFTSKSQTCSQQWWHLILRKVLFQSTRSTLKKLFPWRQYQNTFSAGSVFANLLLGTSFNCGCWKKEHTKWQNQFPMNLNSLLGTLQTAGKSDGFI